MMTGESSGNQPKADAQPEPMLDEPAFPSVKPAELSQLRHSIESGNYEAVEETIWANPRCLISVSDSATYLMAGPKYNALHIAARANEPNIMALLLDTITNFSFIRKLYPSEPDSIIKDRVNHLLDSYLNTPDPRMGNTPLHFACKLGHHRVVRVLLTFEGCDLNLRDRNGKTAEESICTQYRPPPPDSNELEDQLSRLNLDNTDNNGCLDDSRATVNLSLISQPDSESLVRKKIKNMFKQQFDLPLYRDQLKKRLTLERRRIQAAHSQLDSSFSDIDESFLMRSPLKQKK